MNDFVAGLVGGTCGLVIGHPLDTIKALIQTRNHQSMSNSLRIIMREDSMRSLFRGMTTPFISYGPLNSLLFGVYGLSMRALNDKRYSSREQPLHNVFISGVIAGVVTTIPNNPFELIKMQLQTHSKHEIPGLLDCMVRIYKKNGIRGYFQGLSIFLVRDSFSYGLYFLLFETLRREGNKNYGLNSPIFVDFVCGGLAGALSWFSILPIDVLKSIAQSSDSKMIVSNEIKRIWCTQGIAGFYKGGQPVLLRAFTVNSVIFCVYSQVLEFLNKNLDSY